uniref:EF-hand domain-containing protein n=1 Tax=Noctiluca scintillans TaxID=2966 RepID=A0A7S1AKP8_NOCSC
MSPDSESDEECMPGDREAPLLSVYGMVNCQESMGVYKQSSNDWEVWDEIESSEGACASSVCPHVYKPSVPSPRRLDDEMVTVLRELLRADIEALLLAHRAQLVEELELSMATRVQKTKTARYTTPFLVEGEANSAEIDADAFSTAIYRKLYEEGGELTRTSEGLDLVKKRHNYRRQRVSVKTMAYRNLYDRLRSTSMWDLSSQKPVSIRGVFQAVARSLWFEQLFCLVIVFNVFVVGAETQYNAANLRDSDAPGFVWLSYAFAVCFLCELSVRFIAVGPVEFFCLKNQAWNVFDSSIVLISVVEVLLEIMGSGSSNSQSLDQLRLIRIVRTVRVLRVVRLMRFFSSLRLLVTSILSTLKSLLWTMLLLFMILYVFAIIFTQATTPYLIDNKPRNQTSCLQEATTYETLNYYFGDLPTSIFTLFKAIAGGVSWQEVSEPLRELHFSVVALFIVFIAFVYIVVLNVVTGVFCQTALENAAKDKDIQMDERLVTRERDCHELAKIFQSMDADGDKVLTLNEFEESLLNKQVQAYFASLDLTVKDALGLFRMLDCDGSSGVDIEEFVDGCLRLRGNAKSVDVAALIYENRLVLERFTTMMRVHEEQFLKLQSSLTRRKLVSNSQPVAE